MIDPSSSRQILLLDPETPLSVDDICGACKSTIERVNMGDPKFITGVIKTTGQELSEVRDIDILSIIYGSALSLIGEQRSDYNETEDALRSMGIAILIKSGEPTDRIAKYILPFLSDKLNKRSVSKKIAESFVNSYKSYKPCVAVETNDILGVLIESSVSSIGKELNYDATKNMLNYMDVAILIKNGESADKISKHILPFISDELDELTRKRIANEVANNLISSCKLYTPGVYKVKKSAASSR